MITNPGSAGAVQATLAAACNGQILVNADFRCPVNRNGKMEYTESGTDSVTLDRWNAEGYGSVQINNGWISIHNNYESGTYLNFFQLSSDDVLASLRGKTVTATALVSGTCDMVIGIDNSWPYAETYDSSDIGILTKTYTIPSDATRLTPILLQSANGNSANIYAAKLELGTQQTLARQNEDGEWEIIDPPDYDLQYALCSLYSPSTGEWVGNQHSNRNLFINADFRKLVNRKGGTEYTVQGYTADRWILQKVTNSALYINDGYVTLSAKNNDGILQKFYPGDLQEGSTYTCSLLTVTGELLTHTFVLQKNVVIYNYTGTIWYIAAGAEATDNKVPYVWACITYNQEDVQAIDLVAAKLELGPVQTLAHQNTDGTWVLNDPSDYDREYATCIQYDLTSGDRIDRTPCNTNLLANSYFLSTAGQADGDKLPINQRGSAYYSSTTNAQKYVVDRWWMSGNAGLPEYSCTISTSGMSLLKGTAMYQNLCGRVQTGDCLTFSALIGTELCTITFYWNNTQGYSGQSFANGWQLGYSCTSDYVQIYNVSDTTNLTIKAAKLEFGNTQTLAYAVPGGGWNLLGSPPDPAAELVKCLSHQYVVTMYGGNFFGIAVAQTTSIARAVIHTPVPLRTTPTLVLNPSSLTLGLYTSSDARVATKVEVAEVHGSDVVLSITANNLTVGQAYLLSIPSTSASMILDSNP